MQTHDLASLRTRVADEYESRARSVAEQLFLLELDRPEWADAQALLRAELADAPQEPLDRLRHMEAALDRFERSLNDLAEPLADYKRRHRERSLDALDRLLKQHFAYLDT